MTTAFTKRLRLLASVVSVLALFAVITVVWIYSRVRASLATLDGSVAVAGLSAATTIERDSLGVPTIKGANRADVARALGFIHAQERYFQMDVWRRAAAGEMSALFGVKTIDHDRRVRRNGFRKLAQATVAQLPPEQRALLDAYTAGVNAGLAALEEKPFEYLVVRGTPEPWRADDTILVSHAMLLDLQEDTGRYEQTLMTLRDELGPAGLAFFAPLLTPADAALDGTRGEIAALPTARTLNLRSDAPPAAKPTATLRSLPAGIALDPFGFAARDPEIVPGSNAFALAGAHTANGAALLASDMHLGLRVPNVWFRASLRYQDKVVTGVTLPGVPLIIAGSNGRVAWSFTNSYADTGDLIAIDVNPVAPTLYRVPNQPELLKIERRREVIEVRGGKREEVEYEWTIWGPIVGKAPTGQVLSFLWTGHDPAATNLALLDMESADTVRAAVAVAHRAGMPAQNMLAADAAGNVAWTIAGRLPRRVGYPGRLPVSFQFGDRSWNGYLSPAETPVVITAAADAPNEMAAPDGRIWSGNQRMMGGKALELLGDGGYARPNRAAQIRDLLAKLERATPRDLLKVQLDDRALFLARWHKVLLDTLSPQAIAQKGDRGALRGFVEKWEGHASVDAVTYRVVRLFRIAVLTRSFSAIFRSCTEENPGFWWSHLLLEGAMLRILEERPLHLLDPQFESWDALLVTAVDDIINEMNSTGVRLPYATWGETNRADIRHPFSYSLPWFVRPKLDMPADPLPGDHDMPRVQGPSHGASERFVVAPGHEAEGIFHMPCGQSGHPLSPFYRAGHDAWVKGEPTPFLPGKTLHTLVLEPAR